MGGKMIIKNCDKCHKRSRIIKRCYYSYFGFDLCSDCLKNLQAKLNKFFESK